MNLDQARELAFKLKDQGKDAAFIAQTLTEKGYKAKNGNVVTSKTVGPIFRTKGKKAAKKANMTANASTTQTTKAPRKVRLEGVKAASTKRTTTAARRNHNSEQSWDLSSVIRSIVADSRLSAERKIQVVQKLV